MYRVVFELGSFRRGADRAKLGRVLAPLLQALCAVDSIYLEENPDTPWLYRSGVRYMTEQYGLEDWRDIPAVLKAGWGDCEDLACWRAAELRVREGIAARPAYRWRVLPGGTTLYHIVVQYPDGRIEDPSRALGMGKAG